MAVAKPPLKTKTAANRSRRHGSVKFIVLHETCGSYPGDLEWLTVERSKVSVDFYARRNGELWQLNPDLVGWKCWHAGVSAYQGYSNLNEYSVGIEMEHADGAADWPAAQVAALAKLVAWLVGEFGLDLSTHPVVSHAQVAWPRSRKSDPRNFPWDSFGQELRRLLGQQTVSAKLVWGQSNKPIDVDLHSVGGSMFANTDELVAATGLSLLVPESADGMVAVRAFFEAHGYRVEWDADERQVEVFSQG